MLNSSIGSQLKSRRKTLRVTQSQLADMAGVSVNTLYKIERDQANPTLEILKKIADVLGLELDVRVKNLQNSDS